MSWLLVGRKLGARTLRLGEQGADVRQLHEFLRLQGYDLGEEENYGYLTKDAVRQFQRDHGLIADGIAGRRFFALILNEDLPIRRRVHVVQPQETLEQIAEQYGIGSQAFGQMRPVYPGQRLVFFDREIWGMCTNSNKPHTLPTQLTGLVCTVPPDKENLPCIIRPNLDSETDAVEIHQLLKSPKRRKKTANEIVQNVSNTCGFYLPWNQIDSLDGARYVQFLKKLRRYLPKGQMLWVELGPGIPQWKLWGGVDYGKVNGLVDRVVLALPLPTTPGPLLQRDKVEALVETLLPHIHSWKILLKTPVYAMEWEIRGETTSYVKLAYSTALSRAFRHGARLEQDGQGGLYYRYQNRGNQFQLRLPHHSSIGEISAVANRHNLAGIILDQLGMEDPRIWNVLISYFHPARL